MRILIYSLFLFWSCIFLLTAFKNPHESDNSITNNVKPKNVIILIGDGMGLAHIYASITEQKLNSVFFRFPYTGLSITNSASHYITDSGAGGTALSTGVKTNNAYIGIGPKGDTLKNIFEIARLQGISTGVVASSYVTHATPASFVAHNSNREKYEEIAYDFLKSNIDVFIGGGRNHFNKRQDLVNLYPMLQAKGYDIIDSLSLFEKVDYSKKIAGLLYENHPPKRLEGRGDMLSISTKVAINKLQQNTKGFILMVEGSQIDWASHDNSLENVLAEMSDFQSVIADVLDFAEKDGNTLVIVTADHETGGLSLTGGSLQTGTVIGQFSSKGHTSIPVPVFAFGPGAENFSGLYQNTEIFSKIVKILHL